MKTTIRKLITCTLAVAALTVTTTPSAFAQTEEEAIETQGWCEIVPRFCCSEPTFAGGRCRPV